MLELTSPVASRGAIIGLPSTHLRRAKLAVVTNDRLYRGQRSPFAFPLPQNRFEKEILPEARHFSSAEAGPLASLSSSAILVLAVPGKLLSVRTGIPARSRRKTPG